MIIDQTYQPQLPTNLSDPLMEANGMLTVYTFSVQRDLKSTVFFTATFLGTPAAEYVQYL